MYKPRSKCCNALLKLSKKKILVCSRCGISDEDVKAIEKNLAKITDKARKIVKDFSN